MSDSLTHSLPFPILNARYSLAIPFSTSAGTPTDPTTPDTEFSIDGGATFGDCAEEITTGGTYGTGYLTLSGAETNNKLVILAAKSANCVTSRVFLHCRNLPTIGSGTLSAGSSTGGTLGTLLAYDVTNCFIRTTGGTGGGGTGGANNQARRILTYNTTTGAFTCAAFETTPDATTTYDVLLPEGVTLGMLKTLNPATAGRTLVVDASGLGDANIVKAGPTGFGVAWNANTTTHLNTIFDTDYATVYDTTNKAFNSKLGNFAMGGSSLAVTYIATQDFSTTQKASITTAVPTAAATAAAVELAILNEGDATALLAAIAAKVEQFLINEGDATATLAAIGAACNTAVAAGIVGTNAATAATQSTNAASSAAALVTTVGAAGAGLTAVGLTSAYNFAKGTVAMTESYNADGAAPTPAQALMVIMQMLTEMNISDTTMTIKKLDGTNAFTLTLDSATSPTSLTRAS